MSHTHKRVVIMLTSQYISFSDKACILLFRTLDACTFGGILHSMIERRSPVKVAKDKQNIDRVMLKTDKLYLFLSSVVLMHDP